MAEHITLTIFADPGHAWCRFPKDRLDILGISEKITRYSYQRGEYAYLEEDCDLSTLVDALKAHGYEDIRFKTQHTDRQSKIRGYASYAQEYTGEPEYDPLDDFNYVGSRHHY